MNAFIYNTVNIFSYTILFLKVKLRNYINEAISNYILRKVIS